MDTAPRLPLLSRITLIVLLAVSSTGCEVVEGIFKAGLLVGVIAVVLVLAIVGFLVAKLRRR